ncbi:MAG: hypothetical protein JNK78_08970 [Planctomycetes bacterium]|nr:hypothetical protein [Planctomycetota bacterium]
MQPCARRRPSRSVAAAFLFAVAACGEQTRSDPANREVPWTYGPVSEVASAEHSQGVGGKSGPGVTKGWKCRLEGGKRLVVRPYELASSHPLFGKVVLAVGLFDKNGKDIETVTSGVITATNATFTFDLTEASASRLWDLVLWYRKA